MRRAVCFFVCTIGLATTYHTPANSSPLWPGFGSAPVRAERIDNQVMTAEPGPPTPSTIYVPDLRKYYVPIEAPAYAVAATSQYVAVGSGPRLASMVDAPGWGLRAVGVSNSVVVDAGTSPFQCIPHDIEFDERVPYPHQPVYAYALCADNHADRWTPATKSALVTFSTGRFAPTAMHTLPLDELTHAFARSGDWAYVAGGLCTDPNDTSCHPELVVVDLTDPTRPKRHGTLELGMTQLTVTVDGDALLVGGWTGVGPAPPAAVRIVDISQPDQPFVLGGTSWQDTLGAVRSLARIGDRLYAARTTDSYLIDVLDATDLTEPKHIGEISLQAQSLWVHSLVAAEGHLIATGQMLDVWDPDVDNRNMFFVVSPVGDEDRGRIPATVVGQLALEDRTQGSTMGQPIAVSGKSAYIARGSPGGMFAVDFSQPDQPRITGTVKPTR